MEDSAAGTDDTALRSAFLAALGAEADRSQADLLQQELEWFAHPRVRAAAARMEPVDTLVENAGWSTRSSTSP